MKIRGLLKKDLLVLLRAYKLYLLIIIMFMASSLFMTSAQSWQIIFPALICGMMPVSLYSLDERDKWNTYALTTTYTRRGIVSEKYLFGIIMMLAVTAVGALAMSVRALYEPLEVKLAVNVYTVFGHDIEVPLAAVKAVETVLHCAAISLLPAALTMPFMFALGAEKGRFVAPVVMGFTGTTLAMFEISRVNLSGGMPAETVDIKLALGLAAAAVALYAVSWLASVLLVARRDF